MTVTLDKKPTDGAYLTPECFDETSNPEAPSRWPGLHSCPPRSVLDPRPHPDADLAWRDRQGGEPTAREVTMPRKVCAEPGCPTLTDRTRCTTHERARDRARGTRQERGYGADHDREAKRWRDAVRRGDLVTCWRCGDPITDPNDCHLGHDDHDRRVTRGPEHGRDCNLSAAGRARHGISPDD